MELNVNAGPLVFCQRDYPEYWSIISTGLRHHRQARKRMRVRRHSLLLGDGRGGVGVGIATARAATLILGRVLLTTLSDGPDYALPLFSVRNAPLTSRSAS
jgi:hypothetical protein